MNLLREMAALVKGLISRWWIVAALGVAILLFPFQAHPEQPVERLFRVDASQFSYSPSILNVNLGDRVTIELVSSDVVHGLAVDGYNLAVTGDPGQTSRLSFIADQSGSFRFRCTVTCGSMHPFMIGKIQVGENALMWRAAGLAVLALVAVLRKRY